MSKSAVDRYESAAELAADVRRFLDDRPIQARRAGRISRLRRWTRRNPALASLLVLMAALSIVGPWTAVKQRRLTEAARRQNYNLTLNEAWRAWENSEIHRVESLLSTQIPRSGKTDLRDFAWHHLSGACRLVLRTPRITHPATVTSLAFSPDGRQLVTACRDDVVRVWNANRMQLDRELKGHAGQICSVAISPNGQWIASGAEDDCVKLWDFHAGTEIASLRHADRVISLVFALDGRMLVVATDDGNIVLWDLQDPASPKIATTVVAHEMGMQALAVSPDGNQLASAGYNGEVKIWMLPDARFVRTFDSAFTLTSHSLAYSPDGRFLAVTAGGITLWNTESWTRVGRLHTGDRDVDSVAFSADSRYVIAPGLGRTTIWNIESQRPIGSVGSVLGRICLAPNYRTLAVADGESVYLQPFSTLHAHETRNADSVSVHLIETEAARLLLVGGGEFASFHGRGSFAVYDAQSLKRRYVVRDLPPVFAIDHCPMAPNVVALAGGDRADDQLPSQVILMDVATGSRLGTLLGSPGQSYTVAFSADGSKIAAAPIPNFHFRNAVIDVWDVTTRQRLHTFRCFCAWDLKFSPDGTVLSAAGGARDRAGIQHFDLRNWRGISFIEGALPSACLDYRPDGGQIATGDFDGQVRLIDTKSPSATITANDVGYQLLGTCYASDGRAVFAGGSSGHVKIWDAKTGESRASLKASGPVVSLCSSRDGEILAAGCRNGTITVWYRDGRREIVSVE